ncbi:hypothetical protein D3C71_1977120 [compost metagenome]
MVVVRQAVWRDGSVENRVPVARQAAEGRGEKRLHLDVRAELLRRTNVEVGVVTQGFLVVFAFGDKAQHGARGVTAKMFAQAATESADKHIVGAQREDAGQRA